MRNTNSGRGDVLRRDAGRGGSVSPEVQQVGADDSAVVRQDVSSTRRFKGNSALEIIYSFGFSTRQHILLAYPARRSPGRETKPFSFSFL